APETPWRRCHQMRQHGGVPSADRPPLLGPRTELYDIADDILVVCPRCAGRALVTAVAGSRRLICPMCSLARYWDGRAVRPGRPRDPYFRRPLWLRTPCCGRTLWAYHVAHLVLLERYVAPALRPPAANPEGVLSK